MSDTNDQALADEPFEKTRILRGLKNMIRALPVCLLALVFSPSFKQESRLKIESILKLFILGLSFLFLIPSPGHAEDIFFNRENPETFTTVKENVPKIGHETTVYLGDQILRQRTGYYAECLRSEIDFVRRKTGRDHLIIKGGLICKQRKDSKYYEPDYPNVVDMFLGIQGPQISMPVKLKLNKKKETVDYRFNFWKIRTFTFNEFKESFSPIAIFHMEKNSSQRELEYSGKNGNILYFTYSEFSDAMVRDTSTRKFEIDLTEGNVGAYKGAVFEIVEATNAQIKYKILRHFLEH